MSSEGTRQLGPNLKVVAIRQRPKTKSGISRFISRENLLAVGIILIASSLSPFALAEAGVFPDQIFYFVLMPFFLFYVLYKGAIKINPVVLFVIVSQIFVLLLAYFLDGYDGHLKTIGILFSVGLISALFYGKLLDIRVFTNVAVLFTLGVLLLSAFSFILAFLGYASPIPSFNRGNGEIIFQVGFTMTNIVYPGGLGYFIRPAGVFIEPGELAMYTILAITANSVVLGNRKYERMLIVLGLFTMSLSFYVSLFAFFVFFNRRRELTYYLVIFLVAVFIFGGISPVKSSIIWDYSLGRILDLVMRNIGGNRSEPTMILFSNLYKLKAFGSVNKNIFNNLSVDATIFGPFLRYGILGGTFAYLHIIMFGAVHLWFSLKYSQQNKGQIAMLAIFLLLALNLYHRPFTLHFLYYVYIVAMFDWEWRKYIAGQSRWKKVGLEAF